MKPPRPADSPEPPTPTDDPSGLHPIVKDDLRSALRGAELKTLVGTAVIAVGTAFGAFAFLRGEAKAQIDAGLGLEAAKREVLQKQVDGQDTTIRRVEAKQDRQDQKLDLLLDAQRVPQWKRPRPLKDGGQ